MWTVIKPFRIYLLIALIVTHAQAQIPVASKVAKALPKFYFGVKAGTAFDKLHGVQPSYSTGFNGGLIGGIEKKKLGIQTEVLLSYVTYSVTGNNLPGLDFHIIYLDIPVLLECRIVKPVWLQFGPQLSIKMSASENLLSDDSLKKGFSNSYFSGVIGLEARLPAHFRLGARYKYGINTYNGPVAFNYAAGSAIAGGQAFQFYVCYLLL